MPNSAALHAFLCCGQLLCSKDAPLRTFAQAATVRPTEGRWPALRTPGVPPEFSVPGSAPAPSATTQNEGASDPHLAATVRWPVAARPNGSEPDDRGHFDDGWFADDSWGEELGDGLGEPDDSAGEDEF